MLLKLPEPQDAQAPLRYYSKNREHLADSNPAYAPDFFEEHYWERQLNLNIAEYHNGLGARFFVYERAGDTLGPDIIGSVSLGNIVRKAGQFCFLGYGLDRDKQGCG
ncbi:MAG: hypothetical protein ACRD3W_30205, partial [Terriglobales bacterium]